MNYLEIELSSLQRERNQIESNNEKGVYTLIQYNSLLVKNEKLIKLFN